MELFYRLNPKKMMRYQPFMNELIKQRELRADNQAWRSGSYVQAAIGSVLPRGKRYPDRPYLMNKYDIDEDGEVYEITDAERFWAFAESFNQAKEIKAIDERIAAEKEAMKKSNTSDNET